MTATVPMFPLGSVLLPAVPVALRVFEARYLAMLAEVLAGDAPAFGVVLIERGSEVGGGDRRFDTATMARVVQVESGDDAVGVVAVGQQRVEVTEWLPDDPYPRAEVRELPPLEWSEGLAARRAEVEQLVRAELAVRAEAFGWSADVDLSDDPVEAIWQLAALTPVGPLDQLRLLRSTSAVELLDAVEELTEEAARLRVAFGTPGADD